MSLCFFTLCNVSLIIEFNALQCVTDNALLTQSRFILMESMLLLLALFGLLCVLRFRKLRDEPYSTQWWLWLSLASVSLTLALW